MTTPELDIQVAAGLAAALACGLIVGLERGWRERDAPEGGRAAGLRTFGLLGLLGGVLGLLAAPLGAWPLAAGLVGVAALDVVAYQQVAASSRNLSLTSAVASLVVCALGALATLGSPVAAVGSAVVVSVLLDLKSTLHRGLRMVRHGELQAALQLALLTAVVAPLLPDAGYGPYAAINPLRLWWAVVLIAGLSFAGHVAMRISGTRRGLLWTGLLGGLVSSTAATLALARRARADAATADAAARAALAAGATMALRMALVVTVLRPPLALAVGLPLAAWGVLMLGATALTRAAAAVTPAEPDPELDAGADLGSALAFGLLLGVMAVLAKAAVAALGDAGVQVLALISGLVDVDAITVSVLRMNADGDLTQAQTLLAIAIAALTNTVAKVAIAGAVGGRAFGRRVAIGYGAALLLAAAGVFGWQVLQGLPAGTI